MDGNTYVYTYTGVYLRMCHHTKPNFHQYFRVVSRTLFSFSMSHTIFFFVKMFFGAYTSFSSIKRKLKTENYLVLCQKIDIRWCFMVVYSTHIYLYICIERVAFSSKVLMEIVFRWGILVRCYILFTFKFKLKILLKFNIQHLSLWLKNVKVEIDTTINLRWLDSNKIFKYFNRDFNWTFYVNLIDCQ